MFNCTVIADSVYLKRITTVELTYPRFIHSEILTHRDRERNSGSSRAIPWITMRDAIVDNPVIPLVWGKEQRGMATGNSLSVEESERATAIWLRARDAAVAAAQELHDLGVHKSLCNRLTEPWMWITVVMTATRWENFFRQRCHKDAEIHMQRIAEMIRLSLSQSTPKLLDVGEWHLPYVTRDCWLEASNGSFGSFNCFVNGEGHVRKFYEVIEILKKVSVARCARVSYVQHGEKKKSISKDIGLWDKLIIGSGLGHFSPFGHIAEAMDDADYRSGPFTGWKQYRKEFPHEDDPR